MLNQISFSFSESLSSGAAATAVVAEKAERANTNIHRLDYPAP
jgi:hypothetical protein